VRPVGGEVSEVVQEVDGRGEEAEREERERRPADGLPREDVPRDERDEDEEVLDPLPQADRRDERREAGPTARQLREDLRAGPLDLAPQPGRGPDEDRPVGAPEDREVGPPVRDVVEAALAEALDEPGALRLAAEVPPAVARTIRLPRARSAETRATTSSRSGRVAGSTGPASASLRFVAARSPRRSGASEASAASGARAAAETADSCRRSVRRSVPSRSTTSGVPPSGSPAATRLTVRRGYRPGAPPGSGRTSPSASAA
jgi:hypothetical protein